MWDRHRPYFIMGDMILRQTGPEKDNREVVRYQRGHENLECICDLLNNAHQAGVEVGARESVQQISSGHCDERWVICDIHN